MPQPVVYIPNRIPASALATLRAIAEVRYNDSEDPLSEEEILEGVADAAALVCYSRIPVNKRLLDRASQLRVVSNIAVGYDNFDLPEMNRRGILGTNTPGVLTETTADLTFGLLMAAARRIPEADQYVKSGQWVGWMPSLMVGKDVFGSTIGIIGMGRIGEAVARRAKGFGMRILYHNRTRNSDAEQLLGAEYCSLDDLLSQSDFVVLLTPLSPNTVGLIGERELGLMKSDAILVNAARGPVVDEQALIHALESSVIAGAALDVYEREPVSSANPLLRMQNVVTLPHIGSATLETRRKMAETAAVNVAAALSGERPPNLVNPDVWSSQ